MAENDLKLICQAIPVTDAGSVSTQAHNILLGINGDDVEFDINTGSQPTLFPAPLTHSLNKVSIGSTKTANLNGGFADLTSIIATVNGVPVQLVNNAYVVQPSDDGKTFTVNLKALNFLDGVSSITLVYTDVSSFHRVSITINRTFTGWANCAWGLRIDTSSVDNAYYQYVLGDLLVNGSPSNQVMPLGYVKLTTITAVASMPIIGCIIKNNVTINSSSASHTPSSVAYPITRFWFKGMENNPAESFYDDKLGTILTTDDLPAITSNYGCYGEGSATLRVTNSRTLEYYDSTISMSTNQVGKSFRQSNDPSNPSDVNMVCQTNDQLIFDLSWVFTLR